jgi:large subunit ribosomal protein L23
MNLSQLYRVIKAPHTTEKSVRVSDKNRQVVFKVSPDATKGAIKEAVEKLFSVKVKSVQVVNIKGKKKRFKQVEGQKSNGRKAYVSLCEGHDINVANFE